MLNKLNRNLVQTKQRNWTSNRDPWAPSLIDVSILLIFGDDVCMCFSYVESGFVFVIYVSSY